MTSKLTTTKTIQTPITPTTPTPTTTTLMRVVRVPTKETETAVEILPCPVVEGTFLWRAVEGAN
jgi:hypothetical protein